MSFVITLGIPGKHTTAAAELRSRQTEADNRQLIAANEQQAADLHTALIRGCQDAMLIARLRAERDGLLKANENWRHTVIRAKAEQERLRQAVINARPKIREVRTDLVRPYSPVVVLTYVSPVDHPAA